MPQANAIWKGRGSVPGKGLTIALLGFFLSEQPSSVAPIPGSGALRAADILKKSRRF
jgi:hypothetical protein